MHAKLWRLLSLCLFAVNASAQWVLPESKVVGNQSITFQALFDHPVPYELSDVIVADPPRAGRSLVITKEYLKRLAKQHNVGQLDISGSDRVEVTVRSQSLGAQRLADFVIEYLEQLHHRDEGLLAFSVKWDQVVWVPEGDVSLSISSIHPRALSSTLQVWLNIAVNERHYHTQKLIVDVADYQVLPFARVALSKNQLIGEESVLYKRVNALDYPRRFVELADHNWKVQRPYREGDPMYVNGLSKAPAVSIGQAIPAIVHVGNVRIEWSVKALESGFLYEDVMASGLGKYADNRFRIRLEKAPGGKLIGVVQK